MVVKIYRWERILQFKGTTELDSVSGTPSTNEFKVTKGTDIASFDSMKIIMQLFQFAHQWLKCATFTYTINVENSTTFTKLQSLLHLK